MRDRLIELIDDCRCIEGYGLELVEKQVDYLLENGVIAPPCKVGDAVYFYKAEIDEICPAKVIKICNNFYTPSMPLWITIEYDSKLIGKQTCEMMSGVFKLLCRYAKEEAEKALGKDNNVVSKNENVKGGEG